MVFQKCRKSNRMTFTLAVVKEGTKNDQKNLQQKNGLQFKKKDLRVQKFRLAVKPTKYTQH